MAEHKRHKDMLAQTLQAVAEGPSEGREAAEKEAIAQSKAAESEALAQLRETALRGEIMFSMRVRPLGQDRRWNTYWRVGPYSASLLDPNSALLFVQRADQGGWWVIDSEQVRLFPVWMVLSPPLYLCLTP